MAAAVTVSVFCAADYGIVSRPSELTVVCTNVALGTVASIFAAVVLHPAPGQRLRLVLGYLLLAPAVYVLSLFVISISILAIMLVWLAVAH